MSDIFPSIKAEILMLSDAISQVLEMYHRRTRSIDSILITDYSLISGFIRPRRRKRANPYFRGFDRDIDFVGNKIFSLYNQHSLSAPYKLVFSLPTVIELELSSSRMEEFVKSVLKDPNKERIYDNFMRFVDGDGDPNVLDDATLYERSKQILQHHESTFRKDSIVSLLSMIKTGQIQGLGSFFESNEYESVREKIYTDAHNIFNSLRLIRHDGHNSDINNLIDALNFSETHNLNKLREDMMLSCVTPMPRMSAPVRTEVDARVHDIVKRRSIPATPLVDLFVRDHMTVVHNVRMDREYAASASQNFEGIVLDELIVYHDRIKSCSSYIKNVNGIDELSIPKQKEIERLYIDLLNPVFKGQKTEGAPNMKEKIKNMFNDERAFRERFEQDLNSAESLQAGLSNLRPVIGSEELLSNLDLINDPRIQKIRQELGRMKGPKR